MLLDKGTTTRNLLNYRPHSRLNKFLVAVAFDCSRPVVCLNQSSSLPSDPPLRSVS